MTVKIASINNWWENDPIVTPNEQKASNWWENDPIVSPSQPMGVLEDTARSAPTAAVHAAASVPGMVGDYQSRELWDAITDPVIDWLARKEAEWTGKEPPKGSISQTLWHDTPVQNALDLQGEAEKRAGKNPYAIGSALTPIISSEGMPTSQDIVKGVEGVTGELHKPQHFLGKALVAAGDFLPTAAAPGSAMAKVAHVAVPAVASEAAGAVTQGTAFEPYARMGAAVLGGGATAFGFRPKTAHKIIGDAMQDVTHNDLKNAMQLMMDAEAQGIKLTAAEAVAQVSGNKGLPSLQRMVENLPESGPVMNSALKNRPQQIENAARNTFENIGPRPASVEGLDSELRSASSGIIADTKKSINDTTRKLYEDSRTHIIPDEQFAPIAADPAFKKTLKKFRSDDILNGEYKTLPDNSIGVVDAVTKEMYDKAQSLRVKGKGQSTEKANIYSRGNENARNVARNVSPEYDNALKTQEALRKKYLEPIEKSVIGRMAKKNATAKKIINSLFPENPYPGMANDISESLKILAKSSPETARRLVRSHIEHAFEKSIRLDKSGTNEWGGAKFSSKLIGNNEQKASLKAAIEALPGASANTWKGFERFLDILSATGKRLPTGSATAFNQQAKETMKRSGLLSNTTETVRAFGTNVTQRIKEASDRARIGTNAVEIAKIFTAPKGEGIKLLNNMAKRAPEDKWVYVQALRLLYLANMAGKEKK